LAAVVTPGAPAAGAADVPDHGHFPGGTGGPGDSASIAAWFAGHLPAEWATEATVEVDAEEVLVTLRLPSAPAGAPAATSGHGDGDQGRLAWFRDQTRDERIAIASAAEARFRRKVSWAASLGCATVSFTSASVPVMTRLRMPERRVLDTLIAAGVARSRSDALAWCVRLVGDNEADWIDRLRHAMREVDAVRAEGPASRKRRR
jgi:hypothetical protein